MDIAHIKIIVERHADGFVAYPLGIEGAVIGQGETHAEALANVRSAIRFHIETFGPEVVLTDRPLEVAVEDISVAS